MIQGAKKQRLPSGKRCSKMLEGLPEQFQRILCYYC